MKHPWTAYVIVALLAIGAGVAIAGLPDTAPVEATIVPPTTGEVTDTTVSVTTEPVPETTEPVAETTDVPEPDTTEGSTATTEPPTTDATDPDTATSVPAQLPDRGEIIVGVANGAGVAGAAARNVARLTEVGYIDLTPLDGLETVDFTIVYYADGFEAAALRLADDLDLLPEFIAPLADAPDVLDLPDDTELLAYIGIDRA